MLVGGSVAAVMAGPPLYGMVQSGELDGSTAIGRGLLVAGVCTAGASYVMKLVNRYEAEETRHAKHDALLAAIGEAEEAAERHAKAKAAAEEGSDSQSS